MPADDQIVHSDIDRVLAIVPLQLVGRAFQLGRAIQRLGHIDDLGGAVLLLDGDGLVVRHAQHGTGHGVRTIGGATLTALIPSGHIDLFEIVKADVFGAVDRLGDRRVDPLLRRSLHAHML